MDVWQDLLLFLAGVAVAVFVILICQKYLKLRKDDKNREQESKFSEFYWILVHWLSSYQRGSTIEEYLLDNSIRSVAIYGVKELGELLYEELKGSDVEVKYLIDKAADSIFSEIRIITPNEKLDDVDAVIVTAVHYYDEIRNDISKKLECQIISLKELINSL